MNKWNLNQEWEKNSQRLLYHKNPISQYNVINLIAGKSNVLGGNLWKVCNNEVQENLQPEGYYHKLELGRWN